MAVVPDPEPYRSVCIKMGLLTVQQVYEILSLQEKVAKELDLSQGFLEVCKQRKLLTDDEIKRVEKECKKSKRSSERTLRAGGVRELAGYKVIEKIGEGAMGAVYKVHQKSLDRVVALKVLPPKLAQNKLFVDRFFREARASAALNHPNIVQGIDVGEDKGLHFFAMEFIDGETVGQRFKREGPLPLDDVLEIGRQTSLALAHAHQRGLIHRDIKPDNLMFSKSGARQGGFVIKVMDLGLARAIQEKDAGVTQSGMAVGTPFYISPEQARGEKDLTPACDLYSLSGTLLHVLTGHAPYEGETSAVVMAKHLTDPPPDPRKFKSDMPISVAMLLQKLLAKKPEERYPSAEALAEDFELILKGQRPKHVAVPRGRGKSTGPLRPITSRGEQPIPSRSRPISKRIFPGDPDKDLKLPAGKPGMPSKSFPAVPVASAAVVVMIAAAAIINSMSGNDEAERSVAASVSDAVSPQAKRRAPREARKSKKGEAAAEAPVAKPPKPVVSQKRLEELREGAVGVAKRTPDDLKAQRNAWLALQQAAGDSELGREAQAALDKLSAVQKKRVLDTLRARVGEAERLSAAGDHDGAIALLARPASAGPEGDELLLEARTRLTRKAEEQGAALLAEGEKLLAAGKLMQALESFGKAEGLKHSNTAKAGKAKVAEVKARLVAAQQEAKRAAATKLTEALKKAHPLARKMDFAAARSVLDDALKDKALAEEPSALKIFRQGLERPLEEISSLIRARLSKAGTRGLKMKGDEVTYKRLVGAGMDSVLETARGLIPQPDRRLGSFDWDMLLRLADLSAGHTETIERIPEVRAGRAAAVLALAGQTDLARALFRRAKDEDGRPLTETLKPWASALRSLDGFVAESVARDLFESLQTGIAAKRWQTAERALLGLIRKRHRETAFVKTRVEAIKSAAIEIDNALTAMVAEKLSVKELFRGQVKMQAGRVELFYDFSDPAQMLDFRVGTPHWKITKGNLVSNLRPQYAQIWLNAKFEGTELQVEYKGSAPSDLNCLLGPEIVADIYAGYSFCFGRSSNTTSDLRTRKGAMLTRNSESLIQGQSNSVRVKRSGNGLYGQLNDSKRLLKHQGRLTLPSHFAGLHTLNNATIEELKVTGRLDENWVQERRMKFARAERSEASAAYGVLVGSGDYKGRYSVGSDFSASIAYDFSNADQLQDFVRHGAATAGVHGGVLGAGPRRLPALFRFKDPMEPPFRCSFVITNKQNTEARLTWAPSRTLARFHPLQPPYFGIRVTSTRVRIVKNNEKYRRMANVRGSLWGKRIEVAYDGHIWRVQAPGMAPLTYKQEWRKSQGRFYWGLLASGGVGFRCATFTKFLPSAIPSTPAKEPTKIAAVTPRPSNPVRTTKPAPQPDKPQPAESKQPAEKPKTESPVKKPPRNDSPKDKPNTDSPKDTQKEVKPEPKKPPVKPEPKYRFVDSFVVKATSRGSTYRSKVLRTGQKIRIRALGKWSQGRGTAPVGPEGGKPPYQGHPSMALLATTSSVGNAFAIGKEWKGTWQSNIMHFYPNENLDDRRDNLGYVTVVFEVLEKSK